MATAGQFYWPSVGNYVAAYGQFFMAAYTRDATSPSRATWDSIRPDSVDFSMLSTGDTRITFLSTCQSGM